MPPKRDRDGAPKSVGPGACSPSKPPGNEKPRAPPSPYMPMFESFRAELDEHHDRRERVIKASRDITALSKKMIFTLQRTKQLKGESPDAIDREVDTRFDEILRILRPRLMSDLVGIKMWRYMRQINPGLEELMEALIFRAYLKEQRFEDLAGVGIPVSWQMLEVARQVRRDDPSEEDEVWEDAMGPGRANEETDAACEPWDHTRLLNYSDTRVQGRAMALLTEGAWLMGLFDAVGEMMRWSITAMATQRAIPGAISREVHPQGKADEDAMELEKDARPVGTGRNMVTDLRELRAALEVLDVKGSSLERDVAKKMEVMRTCVEKVETACYGLIVRGSERPKDWVPTAGEEGPRPEPVDAY